MIRSAGLHLANLTNIVCHHLFDGLEKRLPKVQTAVLEPIDRILGFDMPEQTRITPAESAGRVEAKQRRQVAVGPERQ